MYEYYRKQRTVYSNVSMNHLNINYLIRQPDYSFVKKVVTTFYDSQNAVMDGGMI